MKNIFLYRYFKFVLVCFILSAVSVLVTFSAGGVPDIYTANYGIKSDREGMLSVFVDIESSSKIGTPVPVARLVELKTHFAVLFPKFPQDYTFKVSYQQCNQLIDGLIASTSVDYTSKLGLFMTNCYKPLSDILKKITTSYTVIPKAKASPTSGPAPLTVTFDARGSTDPSNDTIPSSNFYWYYKDAAGNDKTIGNGSVVSYMFDQAGNYIVHLTVRSSNAQTAGIFDGEKTLSIDVTPKTAIISIYTNGQKMRKDAKMKIGTQEAEKGVVFDASATIPMGGRQIISNHWDITSKDGFTFAKDGDGSPGLVRIALPGQGEFKVALTTIDNEGNQVTESYFLVVSDPIAILKQTPEKGNTSTTFNFDSSASYSVLSKIKLYTREVFDQNGNKLDIIQGQSIKEKFKEPGSYTVKLTVEDEQAQSNIDTVQIVVDSTDPIPQFEVKPTNEWLYPSRYTLDASITSDIDVSNQVDELSYERFFPEELKAEVIETQNKNERIIVEFNGVGKYKVKLAVRDKYGKMAELEKEVEVKSILRPEIDITPVATYRGNPISFVVKSNKSIMNYQRDFGDGDKRSLQVANVTHSYKKTGVYKIKLAVDGADGDKNEVNRLVFIGEKDYPVAGYTAASTNTILTQNEVCSEFIDNQATDVAAYQIPRYEEVRVDPSLSVNSKGEKTDLTFYFQPGGKEIYKQTDFKYKFDEIGCQFIDLTAEDTAIGKNNKVRIWFKVVNALPKLNNVVLFFPQYGNEVGVGFNENQVRDIFNDKFDPLIIKVSAENALDPDGDISYFKWYYYYKDDPNRVLETKITPGTIAYTFFSLPRIAGEYMFGVTMYDNNDGKQSSEQIIGNGPIVFFPPDVSKPDIPLVTLRANQASVEIGDEVTFEVASKIISDRPDFIKERTIYYDFDGDGTWDLITKNDRVTYTYTKPSDETAGGYTPRASVLYRGFKGVSNGGKIIVKNGLKPKLLYDTFDRLAIFRDVSIGDVEKKTLCLDIKNCTDTTAITGGRAFSYEYPSYDKYFISLDVSDKFANTASKKLALTFVSGTTLTGDFHILSIPQVSWNGENPEFFVGKNLDNAILYYIKYERPRGECYVDVDINTDSTSDGTSDNDRDFDCNQLFLYKYVPSYASTMGRIYYSNSDLKLVSKDFKVSFLDFEVQLEPKFKKVYDDTNLLLKTMEGDAWGTGNYQTLKTLVLAFRDGLMDPSSTKSNIVQITEFIKNNGIELTEVQTKSLNDILAVLSDKAVIAAQGGTEYQKSKAEILSILPANLAVDVSDLFTQFENAASDQTLSISQQDERKILLQKIVDTISANVAAEGNTPTDTQIDKIDMDTIIMPNMCIIMNFYAIPTTYCIDENTVAVPDVLPPVEQGAASFSLLKIIFIVLGILVGVFVALVVVFAIRARRAQAKEELEANPVPPAV